MTNKIFGGGPKVVQTSCSIIPYLNGYAATGLSGAVSFTEGATYGNFDGGGPFISYIDTYSHEGINVINRERDEIIEYPNPASDYIKITILKNEAGILTVINSMGQTLFKQPIQQFETVDIGLGEWSKGIYLIKWQGADGHAMTNKLIKN